MRLQVGRAHALDLFDELEQRSGGPRGVDGGAVNFGTVARRQNHRFRHAARFRGGQTGFDEGDGFSGFFGAEGNALTHRKRRGLVIEAETKQLHGVKSTSAFVIAVGVWGRDGERTNGSRTSVN